MAEKKEKNGSYLQPLCLIVTQQRNSILFYSLTPPIRIIRTISGFVWYLGGGDVEDFSDLAVQLPDVSEAVDPARGTPVSQLGVEDELRPRVVRRPSRRG